MDTATYAKAREAAWRGEINLVTDDVRFVIVDGDFYVPDLATDEFLSDIPTVAVLSTSDLLTGKSVSGQQFVADPISFSDNPGTAGSPVIAELLVGYIDTTNPATSRIFAKVGSGSNLPITLNGSNVTAIFPGGVILDI